VSIFSMVVSPVWLLLGEHKKSGPNLPWDSARLKATGVCERLFAATAPRALRNRIRKATTTG
ncbi:MAG: hypothetical protein IJQ73_01255, partial [Kiritimatiellae bacterium]|nr:hypothetical protein [Kiritimatiellia bacterium]